MAWYVALTSVVGLVVAATVARLRCSRRVGVGATTALAHQPPLLRRVVALRVVNMDMLPFRPVKRRLRRAVKAGLCSADVDYLVMQELFRQPWAPVVNDTCTDLLLAASGEGFAMGVVAVVPHPTSSCAKATDSGLAVASVGRSAGVPVHCVAFMPLTALHSFDRLADKGVAVFDVHGGALRVATTHLQASYQPRHLAADNALRRAQFEACVAFAVRHGADLLAGDINVAEEEEMAKLDAIVAAATEGRGMRFPDDGRPSCHRFGIGQLDWRDNAAVAVKIDHCWLLNTTRVRAACPGVTQQALTRGWSDHAAIDYTVELL